MAMVEGSEVGPEGRGDRIVIPHPLTAEWAGFVDEYQMKPVARWTPVREEIVGDPVHLW